MLRSPDVICCDTLLVLLALTKLRQCGAAGLQPGLPDHVPHGHLVFHGLHRPLVPLGSLLHHGQGGVEGRLGVRRQRRALRRVPREVEQQRGVVVGHVTWTAEAELRVETSRLILRAEVWREEKGFPH